MKLATLPALLLFLGEGQSGYDVRRLFQTTPLRIFSDSPGAIYPALARLECAGLLWSDADTSRRKRRVYHRTKSGEAALADWLLAPVGPDTIERSPHEVELRYVLIAQKYGGANAAEFLADAAGAFRRRIAQLEAFVGSDKEMGVPARDALDLGVRLFRTRLQWCLEVQQLWVEKRI